MVDTPSFDELIRRVRAGDPGAAAELVRRYEPAIRRAVRFRLADARLGPCSTRWTSASRCWAASSSGATGQYKLETPEQL